MTEKTRSEKIFSAFFKQSYPADLIFVEVWLAAAIGAIYLPVLNSPVFRIVLTLPVVLFIPGYCLIAALFPKKGEIGLIERIMLSVGVSLAVVPLIGFGLNFTPFGIGLDPILITLIFFTWVMVLLALYQRAILPSGERFNIPFFETAGGIRDMVFPPEERSIDRFLSIILIMVIAVVIIAAAYVIITPREGERFSEFYILGEKQTAANYPEVMISGNTYPMHVGVGNHEYRDVHYTIETWILHTEFDSVTNSTSITAMNPHDWVSLTLAHNETMLIPYNLSLKTTAYNRMVFLLFNETVPGPEVTGRDRINASYRNLHLGITVSEAENEDPFL